MKDVSTPNWINEQMVVPSHDYLGGTSQLPQFVVLPCPQAAHENGGEPVSAGPSSKPRCSRNNYENHARVQDIDGNKATMTSCL